MNSKGHSLVQCVRVLFVLLLFLLAGACAVYFSERVGDSARAVDAPVGVTVILDAGHGGVDGGAVGTNGVYEKDLNLAVANELAHLLRAAGVEVIMTRTEDVLLYGEEGDVPGHRKENDLKSRLAVAQAHPDAIFVSIHMNSFSQAKYSGLQVYYASTEGSRTLADAVQGAVHSRLQPENHRVSHAASSSIFLLDKAVGRSILIECGFLSNPAECQRLSEKDYQGELCFSIFCGMMEYINGLEEHTK